MSRTSPLPSPWPTLLGLLALCSPGLALAGALAHVEVYDRTARESLPLIEHEGRLYVAGEPLHQYELRIRNAAKGRILAVTSVDALNVISGQTAAHTQSGYVIEPGDRVRIEGWRKSLEEVATFYFTRLEDSYAARTGRPHDVGVIGVALFNEHQSCCEPLAQRPAAAEAPAPAARSESGPTEAVGAQRRRDQKLGTGHGQHETSPAQYVQFRRATPSPEETIIIYYDSRQNLIAQGVLPPPAHLARHRPDPFPGGFVPDP